MQEEKTRKLFRELYKQVRVKVWMVGLSQPFIGSIHVDKTIRLSDHLNLTNQEFIIITDVECDHNKQQAVLFLKKENIVAVTPIDEE